MHMLFTALSSFGISRLHKRSLDIGVGTRCSVQHASTYLLAYVQNFEID